MDLGTVLMLLGLRNLVEEKASAREEVSVEKKLVAELEAVKVQCLRVHLNSVEEMAEDWG